VGVNLINHNNKLNSGDYVPKKLEGVISCIPTPFTPDAKKLDEPNLRNWVNYLIESGVNGLMALGSSGEFVSLSDEERLRVFKIVADECRERVPLVAGICSPVTDHVITLTKQVEGMGVHVVMLITPYYHKPYSDQGKRDMLYRHYKEIAEHTDIPICVYNNPGRTGINVDPKTMKKLAEIDNIKYMKQSNPNLDETCEIIRLNKIDVLYSVENASQMAGLLLGAKGMIVMSSIILPHTWAKVWQLHQKGNIKEAWNIYFETILPVDKALLRECNPAPLKEALSMIGRPAGPPRLPLGHVTEETREGIKKVLQRIITSAQQYGDINLFK